MPKIVAHGTPVLIGYTNEWAGWGTVRGDPPDSKGEQDVLTLNYGMWCTTDDGKSYVYYAEITPKQARFQPDGSPVPGTEVDQTEYEQDLQQQGPCSDKL